MLSLFKLVLNIKTHLIIGLLLSFSIQNAYSQKDNSLAAGVAGAALGLGLGVIATKLAINELEDQQEALMLEWLIENNEVHAPSGFNFGTINWNFNSYTDIYRANVLAFYLKNIDTSFVYLKVVGNENYVNKYGTGYSLRSVLKYNKQQWEDLMLDVLRTLDQKRSIDYVNADSIYVRSYNENNRKWVKLSNIRTYNRLSGKIKYQDPGDYYGELVREISTTNPNPNHHNLFQLNSGILHKEKLTGDWSENELTIYIPSIQQSIRLKFKELLQIYRHF